MKFKIKSQLFGHVEVTSDTEDHTSHDMWLPINEYLCANVWLEDEDDDIEDMGVQWVCNIWSMEKTEDGFYNFGEELEGSDVHIERVK